MRRTESVIRMFSWVGAVALVVLFLLIISDVIGRSAFNSPTTATIEMSEYLVVIVAFVALGYTQLKGGHVRIKTLVSRFSPRLQAIIEIFVLLLALGLFTIMSWVIAQATYEAWVSKAAHWGMVTFPLPTWPPYLAALIGSSMLVVSFLIQLVRDIIGLITGTVTGVKI